MTDIRALLIMIILTIGFRSACGAAEYNPKADRTARMTIPQILQKAQADEIPNWGIEVHRINKMRLTISNGGTFGTGFPGTYLDPETGQPAPSCEYPAGSEVTYLYYGALWAGAIVGRDTLVSIGIADWYDVTEFWPPAGPEGAIMRRSNMKTSTEYSSEAVSEQDFVCVYSDTIANSSLTGEDPADNRPHIPLGLEISQRTFGWSYDYAEDFILFDFTIRNINRFPLKQVYFGIYVDPDVWHESGGGAGYTDDICGYIHDVPAAEAPGCRDTIRVAWTADNDGDPNVNAGYLFDYTSATAVTGTAILRTPSPDMQYSFNWWITNYGNPSLDWGPRKAGTPERPFRDFNYGLGSPRGDRNKYHVMSSGEFDYDQLESAVSHTGGGWLAPSEDAPDFADGFDARYLFAFGPFELEPGDTMPITAAYVAGDNFHQGAKDFVENWNPLNPSLFQNKLGFHDLGKNAKWANWIFDNPGVDTDGDGDSGRVCWSVDSTTLDSTPYFYCGDGVADFKGASPPPAPQLTVFPEYGKIRIRWNGEISENNIDIFSGQKDFEGYRVYMGEDDRESDYVLLTSYDREDYNIYWYDDIRHRWNISETPLSRDSIGVLFGTDFDPNLHNRPEDSHFKNGVAYYFSMQDWNQSSLTNPLGIHRVYPDADPNDPSDTTDEGGRRWYEYEYVIDNVLPSRPYYVTITAFDYGSRRIALSSLESAYNLNAVFTYPLPATEMVEAEGLQVVVYPNPYRIDGGYARDGFENRDRTKSAERSRSIHFANLPNICTIRIFTVDGDLVQEIDHYRPDGGPTAQHERWNLISRNTQAVVTGIYMYHVTSAMGEQIGKIVIIK